MELPKLLKGAPYISSIGLVHIGKEKSFKVDTHGVQIFYDIEVVHLQVQVIEHFNVIWIAFEKLLD